MPSAIPNVLVQKNGDGMGPDYWSSTSEANLYHISNMGLYSDGKRASYTGHLHKTAKGCDKSGVRTGSGSFVALVNSVTFLNSAV